jgi:hypothetical protein
MGLVASSAQQRPVRRMLEFGAHVMVLLGASIGAFGLANTPLEHAVRKDAHAKSRRDVSRRARTS